jgi:uncharacterized protein (UPF0333 family)
MVMKKFFSKNGQISIELSILIMSAIVVGGVAVYYYIYNLKTARLEQIGEHANHTSNKLGNIAQNSVKSMSENWK